MMKKHLNALFLFVAMISLLNMTTLAVQPDLANFQKVEIYSGGTFSDVSAADWYASGVQEAFELGLMKGQSANTFGVNETLTVAETIALAARLHSVYLGNGDNFEQGSLWYQVYVDYALENGLVSTDFDNYLDPIYRGDFAYILGNALPRTALKQINRIEDGAIPDVPKDSYIYDNAYRLYRAGVLTGSDEKGTFAPNAAITRAEVATIISRMANQSQRQSVTLVATPITLYGATGDEISAVPNEVDGYIAAGYSLTQPEPVKLYAPGNRILTVWPSEVASYEQQGWSKDPPVARDTPIRIFQMKIGSDTYLGGIDVKIYWNNHSEKDIKYITFAVTPYNQVWDKAYCTIAHKSTMNLRATGPFPKTTSETVGGKNQYIYDPTGSIQLQVVVNGCDKNGHLIAPEFYDDVFTWTAWENVWWNENIEYLIIDKVVIEYMDGSKVTLTGNALEQCKY